MYKIMIFDGKNNLVSIVEKATVPSLDSIIVIDGIMYTVTGKSTRHFNGKTVFYIWAKMEMNDET